MFAQDQNDDELQLPLEALKSFVSRGRKSNSIIKDTAIMQYLFMWYCNTSFDCANLSEISGILASLIPGEHSILFMVYINTLQ